MKDSFIKAYGFEMDTRETSEDVGGYLCIIDTKDIKYKFALAKNQIDESIENLDKLWKNNKPEGHWKREDWQPIDLAEHEEIVGE